MGNGASRMGGLKLQKKKVVQPCPCAGKSWLISGKQVKKKAMDRVPGQGNNWHQTEKCQYIEHVEGANRPER